MPAGGVCQPEDSRRAREPWSTCEKEKQKGHPEAPFHHSTTTNRELAAGNAARGDAAGDRDQQVFVVQPDPALTRSRALQAMTLVATHSRITLPVIEALSPSPLALRRHRLVRLRLR